MTVMETLVNKYGEECSSVLDFGSRNVNGTYESLFEGWEYIGCDIQEGLNVNLVMPDEYIIPMEDRSMDMVVSGNTLEHTRNPFRVVKEMSRVADKILIIGAPFQVPEHRYPLDCWRFLPDGMRELAANAGVLCEEAFIYNNDCWLVARR